MSRHVDFKSKDSKDSKHLNQAPPKAPRWRLLEAGYAPATVKKYKSAVHRFLDWCMDFERTADTTDDLDFLLADYFQELFDDNDGGCKSVAVCTLQGIRMYAPRLKSENSLPYAATMVTRWSKAMPSVSWPPLTWDLTVVIACQMTRNGFYEYGVGTLLAFHCLLRVGELCALRREDFADAHDSRLGSEFKHAVVSIGKAKTGRFQSVQITDSHVQGLVRAVVTDWAPKELLFPGGVDKYRSVFKRVCAELGLDSRYVPHSLRHGGATRLHLTGMSLEDILMRGRWKSTSSARTYVQSGRAMLMAVNAPESITKAAAVLSVDVSFSMALSQKH